MIPTNKKPTEDDLWRDSLSYDEFIGKQLDETLAAVEAKDAIKEVSTSVSFTDVPSVSSDMMFADQDVVIPVSTIDPLPPAAKFNEHEYLAELREYLAGTYNAHYATGKVQAFELIASSGLAEGFCMGSVMKYASRYGKKNGHNRKDLLKIIHYAMLQLWVHDQSHTEGNTDGKEASKEDPR